MESSSFKSSDLSTQSVVTIKTRKARWDHCQDGGVGAIERAIAGYKQFDQENGRRDYFLGSGREVNTEEGRHRIKGNGKIQGIL